MVERAENFCGTALAGREFSVAKQWCHRPLSRLSRLSRLSSRISVRAKAKARTESEAEVKTKETGQLGKR
jgi:hypothetical protein